MNNIYFVDSNDLTKDIQSVLFEKFSYKAEKFLADLSKAKFVFITKQHSIKSVFYIKQIMQEYPSKIYVLWGKDDFSEFWSNDDQQKMSYSHHFDLVAKDDIFKSLLTLGRS